MMKILMPSRILDKNVGGNTTYARSIAQGLSTRGVFIERIGMGNHPLQTIALETLAAKSHQDDQTVIHYVADTGSLLRSRTPAVVTVHGVASRWISTARRPLQEKIWRMRVKKAIETTSRIITVSQSSAHDIASVFDVSLDCIDVIPHGIDLSLFSKSEHLSKKVSNSIPSEFILYVGNIEPRKNLVELIEAVNMDSEMPHLVIAGKPAWNYEETMSLIARSPRVTYLGFISDQDRATLMAKCIAFVFPSLYEGFGFPVLEAMASGASVITTDRGSLKEVAGPAWTLSGTDRECIREGVMDAIGDSSWMKTSKNAGQKWASNFSWERSVEQHMSVYEGMLK